MPEVIFYTHSLGRTFDCFTVFIPRLKGIWSMSYNANQPDGVCQRRAEDEMNISFSTQDGYQICYEVPYGVIHAVAQILEDNNL